MAWELLPVDYTDAVWNGLKRYHHIDNEDGTISLQDVTVYTGKDKSFFGAKDANRMNEAINSIMSMVEQGSDLYGAFQRYFNEQKRLFEESSNAKATEFNQYTDHLKTTYSSDIREFENRQEELFGVWFQSIRDRLSQDAAGSLQNQVDDIKRQGDMREITLQVNAWSGASAPFSQTVRVSGIRATDKPILVSKLQDGADMATAKAYNKAFARIASGTGTTANGSVTFKVYKKPTIDITVGLKGV